jgi:hypothetical protein
MNVVHGHANLDVLDNCDLHHAQYLDYLFGQKEGIFLVEKNVFLVEILPFFRFPEKLPNFQCQNMEKETMILMLNASHKVYFCNFGYLLFFHFNKVCKKTFFSYFNFYFFIYSGMVNQSNTIAPLGRKDGQAWFLSHIGYLTDNNDQKQIQNTMLIQIYSGHNHPQLWDQLRETTNSEQITKFKAN